MPRRPPPYTRGLSIDIADGSVPRIGDYVVTVGVRGYGSAYLIQHARRVQRRNPEAGPRFMLRVSTAALDDALHADEGKVFEITWYKRKRRT